MENCRQIAKQIRIDCVRMTNSGRSGHVGSMLSMADLIAVLYEKILNVDPKNPEMPERDRFVLSKGHAGAAVYSALAQKGFIPREWLSRYYCDDGKLMGHISHKVPGVEFSTGSLGHGLPVAVGMAIAARYAKSPRRVFCMTSDGDMNEGSTWEAIMFAAQEKLSNLTMIVDYNRVQALGHSEDVIDLRSLKDKLELFGFAVREIDGHNCEEIYDALSKLPLDENKPSAIIAHTTKCKGIPAFENTVKSHYKFIPDEEIEAVIEAIKEAE
ncbi:MAG: transketolase [Oscillospiraceae bacterium]|nr:transketolase [Oscillospiraceae bacterium]MBQ6902722.1 transketolase [Oscillospiraceae bacterium]